MIFGEFLFMGARNCQRCVFLVFRSVGSSFKDLVDQVHLVDQVPFCFMKRKLVCAAAQDDDDDDADSDNEMVAWQGFRWMLSKKDPLVSYMSHV